MTPHLPFTRQVKSRGGYYGCDKCIQRSQYFDKRVKYPDVKLKLRDDCPFRTKKHPSHHIGVSLSLTLPIDMGNNFPLDYMYLVLWGVMERMFDVWLHGLPVNPNRLLPSSVEALGTRIAPFQRCTPCDFQRLRHVDDVKR